MDTRTDRRTDACVPMRAALVRLRLAEFLVADYLPDYWKKELTAAIDGVVALIRKTEGAK